MKQKLYCLCIVSLIAHCTVSDVVLLQYHLRDIRHLNFLFRFFIFQAKLSKGQKN